MIKRIELVNFMSHPHTVIEPAAGLTVLIGPNNCGKSAVVAALQILCHNDKSSYVLRHEEKECSITVETDAGDVIRWSRGKNKSPRYTLNEQQFDRLNQQVPAEICKALRISKVQSESDRFDVHFGEQKNPVFLLNDSPRAAAEFFASSSDTIRLVEMQNRHKQNVRSKNSERKRFRSEINELETALEHLAPLDPVLEQLTIIESEFELVSEQQKRAVGLVELMLRLRQSELTLALQEKRAETLSELKTLPAFHATRQIESTISELHILKVKKQRLNQQLGPLLKINPLPQFENTASLANAIHGLTISESAMKQLSRHKSTFSKLVAPPVLTDPNPLIRSIEKLQSHTKQAESLQRQLKQNAMQLANVNKAIKDLVALTPNCPTCGSVLTAEQLTEHVEGHQHG